MSTLENESSNPDKDYDEHAERAIIADLEEIDKIKAELAEWRKGPWVRKADHDELCERFSTLAAVICFHAYTQRDSNDHES